MRVKEKERDDEEDNEEGVGGSFVLN